jgi:hypothetical protein
MYIFEFLYRLLYRSINRIVKFQEMKFISQQIGENFLIIFYKTVYLEIYENENILS